MSDAADKGVGRLVDHLFRHQAGRMVSTLTRIFGPQHLDLAEEVVQDALLRALQQWPFKGVPENPTAWMVEVARNRALDLLRRETSFRSKSEDIVRAFNTQEALANDRSDAALSGELLDDELGMIFMACHPSIPREGRIALTLKTVGGFGVSEIARAFLAREATIAQRLVRAKRRIREEEIRFELPSASDLSARLDSVLEVIYLLFNEGYTAHSGENLIRKDLCEEAIRLCALLVRHPVTDLPKSHALLSLMLLQSARLAARVSECGDMFLLEEQDRALWDRRLINRGIYHLGRSAEGDEMTEYHLQAGIAACHVGAPSYEATDWPRIVYLYDQLLRLNSSPVVALNRAVALSRWRGPQAGIEELGRIASHPAMTDYYLFHATMGELWRQSGEGEKAVSCYRRALASPCSEPERRFLLRKIETLTG